jgi:Zn-dependent protease with chaperone function
VDSASPPPSTAAAPADLAKKLDPFWDHPETKKSWDLSRLSPDDEKRLGLELHAMVMHFNKGVEDGALQERVEEAAEPARAARSRKEIDYTFTTIDSSAVNAFSHPGGYVYVTRGLLDWIGEDEPYVLQFVLAHEVFHVDQMHALKCLQDPGVKKLPIGTLQAFYLLIFPRGYYPDSMDFEADAWALRLLRSKDCTRRECLTFARKLQAYAQANNFVRGRAMPLSGRVASLFDNHYRAHPAARERLKRLEALLEPAATKPR